MFSSQWHIGIAFSSKPFLSMEHMRKWSRFCGAYCLLSFFHDFVKLMRKVILGGLFAFFSKFSVDFALSKSATPQGTSFFESGTLWLQKKLKSLECNRQARKCVFLYFFAVAHAAEPPKIKYCFSLERNSQTVSNLLEHLFWKPSLWNTSPAGLGYDISHDDDHKFDS